ncbi:hypothetical protein GCM10007894_24580 [Paraferrimonas haliotis]|uniref:Uncharacterized protein n=1 Tax=Paraferrimonas haliotis TaxID=2013866 RepID=A0AA37TUJ7_9GAMM|nr:hypothetical protein GCM10007894_24580 [Paraferrimonas haliotis]
MLKDKNDNWAKFFRGNAEFYCNIFTIAQQLYIFQLNGILNPCLEKFEPVQTAVKN